MYRRVDINVLLKFVERAALAFIWLVKLVDEQCAGKIVVM